MIHVQEVLNFCKRKGFYKAYDWSKAHFVDCTTRFEITKDKLDEANNDPTTTPERKKAL